MIFRPKKKKLSFLLAGILILVVFLSLSSFSWRATTIKNFSHGWFLGPFISAFNFFGQQFAKGVVFLEGVYFAGQKNDDIQKIVLILRSQNAQLKERVAENEFLKEQLNIFEGKDQDLILAKIIAKDESITSGVLIINKGQKDGVMEGQVVVAGPAVILGRIFETTDSFSKVQLLNDPQSQINVVVQEKGLQGVVRGQYGLGLLLEKATWEQKIENGDTILSSGLSETFPAGFLVGFVEEASESREDIHQTALVRPATEVQVLDYVFIIK